MQATISKFEANYSHWLLAAGLASVYLPTYWMLANTIWATDEQFHGAIVLMVVIWLCWEQRNTFFAGKYSPRPLSGSVLLFIGLMLYVVGRSQEILLFEVGSQIPVFAGILLLIHGYSSLRSAWFILLFLIFMVPIPSIIIDTLTGSLKQWISVLVENALYRLDYPIARNGVTLTIGQYQLLVADACSGLNSMFTLTALGLLFMYLMGRGGAVYNGVMLASILPIAFFANFLRVSALVLITYYWGDEAGQGFMHGFAGMVLFLTALSGLFLLDSILFWSMRSPS